MLFLIVGVGGATLQPPALQVSWPAVDLGTFDGRDLLAALQRQRDSLAARLPSLLRACLPAGALLAPRSALGAACSGVLELSRSLPSELAPAAAPAEQRQAWAGLAAGGLCSVASLAVAGLCVCLGCLEIAACTCKTATGLLATQLAHATHFGASAARRAVGDQSSPLPYYDDWDATQPGEQATDGDAYDQHAEAEDDAYPYEHEEPRDDDDDVEDEDAY
jgi:hypothetical protein